MVKNQDWNLPSLFFSRIHGGTFPNPGAQLEVPNKSVATALSAADALPFVGCREAAL